MAPTTKAFVSRNGGKKMMPTTAKPLAKKTAPADYPVLPWKLLRNQYGNFTHQCKECQDLDFNNPEKAIELEDGSIETRKRYCKRCAEGNIFMGNVYRKYFGPKTEEDEAGQDSD